MSLGGLFPSRMNAGVIIFSSCVVILSMPFISGCMEDKESEVDNPRQIMRFEMPAVPKTAEEDSKTISKTVKQVHDAEPGKSVKDRAEDKDQIKKEGVYVVGNGESLYSIAKNEDVYADPLKWISLFSLNLENFHEIEGSNDIEHRILEHGMELNYVTPKMAEKAYAEIKGKSNT